MNLDDKFSFISLGCDCLPVVFLSRSGLIRKKAEGRLTLPFDFALFSSDFIKNMLQTDFNLLNQVAIEQKLLGNTYMPSISAYHCVYFNHESADFNEIDWVENHYEKLYQRYWSRISNFFNLLKENTKIPVFVMHLRLETDRFDITNITEIAMLVSKKYNGYLYIFVTQCKNGPIPNLQAFHDSLKLIENLTIDIITFESGMWHEPQMNFEMLLQNSRFYEFIKNIQ